MNTVITVFALTLIVAVMALALSPLRRKTRSEWHMSDGWAELERRRQRDGRP